MRKIVFVALCAIAVLGCKKASGEYFDMSTVAITGEATGLSSTSVTLTCYFNLATFMNPDKWGVVGSTSPEPTRQDHTFILSMSAGEVDPEYHYEINGLNPGTTYYYRAYMRIVGLGSDPIYYGKVRQFTTPAQ